MIAASMDDPDAEGSGASTRPHRAPGLVALSLAALGVVYGDGMITPAISVLSAVEGLGEVTDAADPYVVPIACAVLFALFLAQRRGTGRIGRVFGPVMLVWFLAIAAIGLPPILESPQV